MHKKKKANNPDRQTISVRDSVTLFRLLRRMGPQKLIKLVRSLPEPQPIKKSPGSPRMKRTRQSLLAVLYHCRMACGRTSISAFASRLPSIVEIRSSRRTPPIYASAKNKSALEIDLRRGIKRSSSKDKDYLDILYGLFFWRFNHVNPYWGFYASGPPHLLVTPKKPTELTKWIDATIKASGVPEDQIRQRYKKPLAEAPPK
jgi:hypothetical protein